MENRLFPMQEASPSRPVECHSGYTYAQRPAAILWEGERLPVKEVEAEWRFPGGKRFRVRAADGRIFELVYHEQHDEWEIELC